MNDQNQILYRDKHANIELCANSNCFIINIQGFLTGKQLIKLFEKGYQLFTESTKPPTTLILNAEKLGAVKKTEQQWLKDTWNLNMFQAGLKQVVIINPDNIFGEVAINTYKENTSNATRYALNLKSFKDMKAAYYSVNG